MVRPSAKRPKTAKRPKVKARHQPGDGDLPTKLLAVTAEILREQGLHGFTLREAAAGGGAAHGAGVGRRIERAVGRTAMRARCCAQREDGEGSGAKSECIHGHYLSMESANAAIRVPIPTKG